MKKISIIIACVFTSIFVQAQSKKDSLNFDEDLELCYITLLKYHPKIKNNLDSTNLKNCYLNISKKISSKTTSLGFKWIVGELTQCINDGHTALNLSVEEDESDYASIPIFIKYIQPKFYISDALNDSSLIGNEILSINDVAIEKWFERSCSFSPQTDNYEPTNYSNQYRKCLAMSIFCDELKKHQTTTKISYLDSGKTITKEIKILFEEDRQNARKAREKIGIKLYDFKKLDDTVAYLKLKSFMPPFFNKGKIKEDFEKIKAEKLNNIILDLRGNTGGSLSYCSWLVSYFIDSTHNMASDLSMRGNSLSLMDDGVLPILIKNSKKKERKQNTINFDKDKDIFKETIYNATENKKDGFQKCKVVVLVDEATYSAASITAIALRQSGKTLMGKPTCSNASTLNAHLFELFELPNSKLVIRMPMLNGNMFDKKTEAKQLLPDIIVPYQVENIKLYKDEVLEKAIEFFKQ